VFPFLILSFGISCSQIAFTDESVVDPPLYARPFGHSIDFISHDPLRMKEWLIRFCWSIVTASLLRSKWNPIVLRRISCHLHPCRRSGSIAVRILLNNHASYRPSMTCVFFPRVAGGSRNVKGLIHRELYSCITRGDISEGILSLLIIKPIGCVFLLVCVTPCETIEEFTEVCNDIDTCSINILLAEYVITIHQLSTHSIACENALRTFFQFCVTWKKDWSLLAAHVITLHLHWLNS